MARLIELTERLEKYGQQHLLNYWNEIDETEREQLINQIDDLDLDELKEFFERATVSLASETNEKLDDRLQPIPNSQFLSINRTDRDDLLKYERIGLEEIAAGRVGVLLMAGGQGTRLGFSHPKGMFDVGLPSHKTLFKIQAERIQTLERLATDLTGRNGQIVWYIMTSEHTMEPTRQYFEENDYFGLLERNVRMFEQGSLPCYGFDGKILLDEKHVISKAPDGNGGIYRSLRDQGILTDMSSRGVAYLHAHSIDNILIKVADPIFIGYCVHQSADCAAKVVEKTRPNEAVGVICIVDGKYQVVEYSEISTKTSERKDPDGRLTFNAGNICNHFFTLEFLQKIAGEYERKLKLHVAQKKIPHIDSTGVRVTPDQPNGIKIEKFVFDVFEFAEKFVAMEVQRDEEFSPLKNSDKVGKECATTARSDIYRLHRKFIERAGGMIDCNDPIAVCEVSPLLSYFGEGLEDICSGKTFNCPVYLRSSKDSMNGHS